MRPSSRPIVFVVALMALLGLATAAQARTWHRVSSPGQSNTSQISVVRNANGTMTVGAMFKSSTTWGSDVFAIPVAKNGPVGTAVVAASGNTYSILTGPTAIRQGGRSLLVFGGANGTFDGLWTYDVDAATTAPVSQSGTGPTLGTGFVSAAAAPAGGMASWSNTNGLFTVALGNTTPFQTLPITGCCAYNSSIAVTSGGATWVVYDSNETGASGRWFQQVDAATGAATGMRIRVPKSNVNQDYSFPVDSRAPVAVVGGAVYTAWAQGYPTTNRLALWKVGTAQPKLWNPGYKVTAVGLARTPAGALWLFWADGGTGVIRAMRSNNTRTRWGRIVKVGRPFRGAETVYKMVGDANRSDGRLNLFTASATYVASPTWYHTVVAP